MATGLQNRFREGSTLYPRHLTRGSQVVRQGSHKPLSIVQFYPSGPDLAGYSSLATDGSHKPVFGGSNPPPATIAFFPGIPGIYGQVAE